ncbi:hypothetical protein RE474_07655 [Methanolobus sediminis]|uniref:DUF4145 domain-containing protein n=1 Tax=Methanolobus sediminis TaxID=3072978 RepID=A0AA51UI61_9EURY|nr:hypothetical protein [Methanolobus sediminis]WMW23976.1 hypothetical protein RE474_07655 [Methanolobus sediminis]
MHNLNIDSYIKEAEEIEKLYLDLIEATARIEKKYHSIDSSNSKLFSGIYASSISNIYEEEICVIDSCTKPLQRQILRKYEIWYEICRRIVLDYIGREETGKYEAFSKEYVLIKNLILLGSKDRNQKDFLTNAFIASFDTQINILCTIEPIIELTQNNYKKVISADLLYSEIDGAELLYNNDFIRPAGIIAGIVLERYLKTLCEFNEIELTSKDTLYPMAQKLRASEKVPDFDLVMLKSIEHLGSLRNKCAHPREEPKKQEVRELIDKTKKITFMAFY